MPKEEVDKLHFILVRIAQNGMVAALYFVITLILMQFPVLSQFGPIQCRISEALVLFAFFRPDLTIGITLGCLLVNVTGVAMGLNAVPMDILIGTACTLVACLCEAYLCRHLVFACLYPIAINGVFIGLELYFILGLTETPLFLTMLYVAIGEAIAVYIGYALFMVLIRNKGFMNVLKPTRHQAIRW